MRLLLLLVIGMILTSGIFAQSKKEVKKNGIKSVVESDIVVANGEEKTVKRLEKKFDSAGNVLEKVSYDKQGVLKRKQVYEYNKKNQIQQRTVFDKDGKQVRRLVYDYNPDGQVNSEKNYGSTDELEWEEKTKYNGFGEMISKITADDKGNILKSITYTYDKKGMRTERMEIGDNGKLKDGKKYEYQY